LKHEDGTDILDELGRVKRETNARVVRWSDGRYCAIETKYRDHFAIETECAIEN